MSIIKLIQLPFAIVAAVVLYLMSMTNSAALMILAFLLQIFEATGDFIDYHLEDQAKLIKRILNGE